VGIAAEILLDGAYYGRLAGEIASVPGANQIRHDRCSSTFDINPTGSIITLILTVCSVSVGLVEGQVMFEFAGQFLDGDSSIFTRVAPAGKAWLDLMLQAIVT
jgi:hypothetical protein